MIANVVVYAVTASTFLNSALARPPPCNAAGETPPPALSAREQIRHIKGNMTSCSKKASPCSHLPITAEGTCYAFDPSNAFPHLLTFPSGMSCDVFVQQDCVMGESSVGRSKEGVVKHVTGRFDAATDARAFLKGFERGEVASFSCLGMGI